jgi:hypothetical protein
MPIDRKTLKHAAYCWVLLSNIFLLIFLVVILYSGQYFHFLLDWALVFFAVTTIAVELNIRYGKRE